MDRGTLFFPVLARRSTYSGKGKGRKSKYGDFQAEIEKDCQKRCVYCDITLAEHGGEGMQLDHFRPKSIFPELEHEPANLVLACPKCNRLKWHYWPVGKNAGSRSHDGASGFVDPFEGDRLEYFEVKDTGELVALKPPGTYMIDLMKLNRKARTQVRRLRSVRETVRTLSAGLAARQKEILQNCRNGHIHPDQALPRLERIVEQINDLGKIQQTLDAGVTLA